MKNSIENTEKLLTFAPQTGGVFSLMELSNLFNISDKQALWNALKDFEKNKTLTRYCRGIYIARNFDPQVLSTKVRTDSYISLGSALAFHKLIGTESPRLISCLVPAKAKEYPGVVSLSYSRIAKDLFFGFKSMSNGVKIADPEKAVLDTLYFHLHGKEYHFNLFQDIHYSSLSKDKLNSYLGRFKNTKFQNFARRIFNEQV